MSMLRVIKMDDGGPFVIFAVFSPEFGYHLILDSNGSWCKSNIPCVGSINKGLREFPQTKVVVSDMLAM